MIILVELIIILINTAYVPQTFAGVPLKRDSAFGRHFWFHPHWRYNNCFSLVAVATKDQTEIAAELRFRTESNCYERLLSRNSVNRAGFPANTRAQIHCQVWISTASKSWSKINRRWAKISKRKILSLSGPAEWSTKTMKRECRCIMRQNVRRAGN